MPFHLSLLSLFLSQKQDKIFQRQQEREAARAEKRAARHVKEKQLEEQSKAFLAQANAAPSSATPTPALAPTPTPAAEETPAPTSQEERRPVAPPGLAPPPASRAADDNKTELLSQVLQIMLKTEIALTPESQRGWFYYDAADTLQGPFDGDSMAGWYDAGYLPPTLKLCSSGEGECYPIAAFLGKSSNVVTGKELFSTDIDQDSVRSLRDGLTTLMETL